MRAVRRAFHARARSRRAVAPAIGAEPCALSAVAPSCTAMVPAIMGRRRVNRAVPGSYRAEPPERRARCHAICAASPEVSAERRSMVAQWHSTDAQRQATGAAGAIGPFRFVHLRLGTKSVQPGLEQLRGPSGERNRTPARDRARHKRVRHSDRIAAGVARAVEAVGEAEGTSCMKRLATRMPSS